MQFFISHLASWLRTRRFSEPFSTLPSHKSLKKHSVSRLSYLFAHLHLLSSCSFSSTLLSSNLSLLSASALLCFSSVHIVGSLTSKLPSIIIIYTHIYIYTYTHTHIHTYIHTTYILHTYIHTYIYIYTYIYIQYIQYIMPIFLINCKNRHSPTVSGDVEVVLGRAHMCRMQQNKVKRRAD